MLKRVPKRALWVIVQKIFVIDSSATTPWHVANLLYSLTAYILIPLSLDTTPFQLILIEEKLLKKFIWKSYKLFHGKPPIHLLQYLMNNVGELIMIIIKTLLVAVH